MFFFIALLFLITSNCTAFLQARTKLHSKRVGNGITIAMIDAGVQEYLDIFASITKGIANLGATGPLLVWAVVVSQQTREGIRKYKALSESYARDAAAAAAPMTMAMATDGNSAMDACMAEKVLAIIEQLVNLVPFLQP